MPKSTTNQWKLGLFVLTALAAMLAIAVWLGSRRFKSETIRAYSIFDEPVTGLDIGSPIRFRGMTIGSIAEVRVAPDRHHLEVAYTIDVAKLEQIGLREPGEVAREGAQVPGTLRAQIERSFVTGVAFVQTDFFDLERYPIPDYPFEVPQPIVHSVPSSQKTIQRGLDEVMERVPKLFDKTTAMIERLDGDLQRADLPALFRDLRGALEGLQRAVDQVDWTALDQEARGVMKALGETLGEVRALVAEVGDGKGPLPDLLARARETVDRLEREVVAADLPQTSAALRELLRGYAAVAPEAADLLPTLRRTADSFRRLADLLERDPAALLRGRAAPGDPREGR